MPNMWIKRGNELVGLQPGYYAREHELQSFVGDHPEVLASAVTGDDGEAQWLLVDRELSIVIDDGDLRTTWSLDHLFLDAAGVPTLVEVKRSSDPRIRREVIAQMLDYVASFRSTWSADSLRTHLQSTKGGLERWRAFSEASGIDEGQFWLDVDRSIASEVVRLLFVADRLPHRVVRIIEFLNEKLTGIEVLGVEVLPHEGPEGEAWTAYVPNVVGRQAKTTGSKTTPERRTRDEFAQMLMELHGNEVSAAVHALVESAESNGAVVTIGKDPRNPRLFLNYRPGGGRTVWPLAINPRSGKVALQLRLLKTREGYESPEVRRQYVERIERAIATTLDAPTVDGYPGFHAQLLTQPGAVERVGAVLEWLIDLATSSSQGEA